MDVKKITKNWIIGLLITLVFSFFIGFYVSYRVTEKSKTKLDIIKEIMEEEWYYGIDDDDFSSTLQEKMILGMLDMNKDPYTRYLTSLGSLADSYTGLGLSVNVYGEYYIIEEVNSKTSIEDGIRAGDVITKINDISVKDKTLNELNELIFANENAVKLTILRNEEEIELMTAVTTYDPITVFTKEYDKVSYIKITEFNFDTASYVEDYLSKLSSQNDSLILDLRGNPGGYISSVSEVADLFLPSNKVVMTTIDKKGNKSVVKTNNDSLYVFNDIVILIDDMSASGAEALSAALDYHLDNIVTLYGDKTYGKGSAQKTYQFSDGTYFHYTYALWYTPEDITINRDGVKPEVESINNGLSSYELYDKELKLYDYGIEVLSIQKILKYLGYYTGEEHSFIDEKMVEEIKLFQESAPDSENLNVNGKIDNKTIRYLAKLIYDDKVSYLDNELDQALTYIAGLN